MKTETKVTIAVVGVAATTAIVGGWLNAKGRSRMTDTEARQAGFWGTARVGLHVVLGTYAP